MSKVRHYHCLQPHQISRNSVERFSITTKNGFWTKWPPGGILGENRQIWQTHTIVLHPGNKCTKFQEDPMQTVGGDRLSVGQRRKMVPLAPAAILDFSEIFQQQEVDHYHCLQSHQISRNSIERFSVTSQTGFWTKWPPGGILGEN